MFIQSNNIVMGRPLADGLIGALSVVPGGALILTPFVHLFTAGPAPILPSSVPADFTEATFVGYAATALTMPLLGPLTLGADGDGVHREVNFLAGAVVPPGETILGYWIDEAAAGGLKLYLAETFATPVPITVAGDFISLDAIWALLMVLDIPGIP